MAEARGAYHPRCSPSADGSDCKLLVISWSGLQRHEKCRQLHLRTIQGKSAPSRNKRDFLPGTVADRVMRAWLESPDPKPGQMARMTPIYFDRLAAGDDDGIVKWRGRNDRAIAMNTALECVKRAEPFLLKHVIPHEYQPELSFSTTIQIPYLDGSLTSVRLVGGIDIATRLLTPYTYTKGTILAGQHILIDLKCTVSSTYINKTLGQAIFYDIGFGHLIKDTSQPSLFIFLQPLITERPIVHVNITDKSREIMMSRIVRMAHHMWRGDWSPKESDSGCHLCQVRHACDRYNIEWKTAPGELLELNTGESAGAAQESVAANG